MTAWGVVKVRGTHRLALCDFDDPAAPPLPQLWRVLVMAGVKPRYIRYDRTARGWHVVVGLPRALTDGAIVALQMALGSDIYRETYNLFRVNCGAQVQDWNLLFSEKLN